jgi:LysR family transcriptional regulator, hydrogen peroxide-inducible genes activator
MTLTELRYIVAVARERHFGRAAEACFVSQPTLSVAVKKLEDELGVVLFERGPGEVTTTPVGVPIIEQAQRVLEEATRIKELAASGRDPLAGTLRLGAIYTIGPYLLPKLIPILRRSAPSMQLLIQENFTHRLAEALKHGEVDVIVVALPFSEPGVVTRPVYDEPFLVAVPQRHPWAKKKEIEADELSKESMLLLGAGHCFRDQVLELCAAVSRSPNRSGIQRTFEGGSLETIRQMVASGVGITVLPATSITPGAGASDLIRIRPFAKPVPGRRVAIAWRRSFPRPKAIEALRQAILACELPRATKLPNAAPSGNGKAAA